VLQLNMQAAVAAELFLVLVVQLRLVSAAEPVVPPA
jgi:hypothetical protein